MTKPAITTTAQALTMLRHIRLELARDHDFPEGSSDRGYELVAPLDEEGRLDASAWKLIRDRCRVRRFWAQEASEVGHIVHKPGGVWAFHYDIHGDAGQDEKGWHLNTHKFEPGEYVSIREHDGVLRTFRVRAVGELS